MKRLKAISFTHANAGLDKVGQFFIAEDHYADKLIPAKEVLGLEEFMFLVTCNRAEFYFATDQDLNDEFLRKFYKFLYPHWQDEQFHWAVDATCIMTGFDAVRHMMHVASSLDSLVIGEREIITQFRKAYEKSLNLNITGDLLRISVRKTVETAKQIFTETEIANKPISVVNLANKQLRNYMLPLDARIVVIGAGVTNQAMVRQLKKQGYTNFSIYNRTLSKAADLAATVNGHAYALEDLSDHKQGFDALITCTGAPEAIITKEVYEQLLNGEKGEKLVIDLAIPNDFDTSICKTHQVELVEVESMKVIAAKNLESRKVHMVRCEEIVDANLEEFKTIAAIRNVELAMNGIPQEVQAIKDRALTKVFNKQLESLDSESRETLEEIIAYMEKKYISVPYKMARSIISEKYSELDNQKTH